MPEAKVTIPLDFPLMERADWVAAAEKALKGASFDRLRATTPDGLTIEPIYPRNREAVPQPGREAGVPWTLVQRVDHPSPHEANALLLADLEGGANGIELVFATSTRSRGYGLAADTLEKLERSLDGVVLDLVKIRLDAGYETAASLALFVSLAEKRGYDPSRLDLVCSADYIGKFATTGLLRASLPMLEARMGDLAHYCHDRGMAIPILSCDGRHWHDGGASDAQELAYTFAAALEYMRKLEPCGLAAEVLPQLIGFTFVAGADQIATIAKARAARRIWSSILAECGFSDVAMRLHMETSWRMMSRRDPWVNILRSGVAAFAAGIGGADSVTVLPFTLPLGLPDAFARRIARNTQLILMEESNLHRVADPSAGSGAIEARTNDLAEAAWGLMQQIEGEGGIMASLIAGTVQNRIATVKAARLNAIATRRQRITGTSAFPDIREKQVEVLTPVVDDLGSAGRRLELPLPGKGELMATIESALKDGASLYDILVSRPFGDPLETTPIKGFRDAEGFEALRDAADGAAGHPTVFLATLGPLAQFAARAAWTKNFFEIGGIEAQGGEGFGDLDEAIAAWKSSGSTLVCLCSSDAVYSEMAVEAAKRFAAEGAQALYIAGKPGDLAGGLAQAGVTTFLYEGCDALAILNAAHDRLGLASLAL